MRGKITSRDVKDQRRIRAKFRSQRQFDAWVADVQQAPKRKKSVPWDGKLRGGFGGDLLFRTAWVVRVAKKELGMARFTTLRWCAQHDKNRQLSASANALAHELDRQLKKRKLSDAELDEAVRSHGYDPASATLRDPWTGKMPADAAPQIYFSRVTV